MRKISSIAILLLLTPGILGCASFSVSNGENIAAKARFSKEYIKTAPFNIMTFQKFNKNSDILRVYIEGDGRAWEAKNKLSDDPTPLNPVALTLAIIDPTNNIAYLARPGQYSPSGLPDCDSTFWSNKRFSPEVIDAMDQVIDKLKEKSRAKYIDLVGYSGGGAIAVLLTARRHDVVALRTVAGNLNTKAFCIFHHVSLMLGSLNPLDVAQQVTHIPQRHFVGSMDTIVPLGISKSFVKMEGDKDDERITVVDGVSHQDGWQKHWQELLMMNVIKTS